MKMRRNQLLMLILAAGFLCGIIYANRTQINMEVFEKESLNLFKVSEIQYDAYLKYIMVERIGLLAVILFFSYVRWKKIYASILMWVIGMLAGIYGATAFYQLGINGIAVCAAAMFPQALFYGVTGWILILYWLSNGNNRWNASKTLAIIILMVLGILSEVYVNSTILKWTISILL